MDGIAKSLVFDDKLVRSAILIMDRQAKLHGLDKQKAPTNPDWLENASQPELIRLAKERGIALPEKFTVN